MNERTIVTLQECKVLNLIRRPCWIFQIDTHRIWWGNDAAMDFWKAETLEELRQKDFSSDSTSVRQRLWQLYENAQLHGSIRESWTLYPDNKPEMTEISLTPLHITAANLPAILVEIEGNSDCIADADNKRQLQAMRYTPLMMSTLSLDGKILSQNPGSILIFGRQSRNFFQEHFADPGSLKKIIDRCQQQGEYSGQQDMITANGVCTHHIEARMGRDPVEGGPAITLTQHDISDQIQAQNDLMLLNLELEQRVELRTKDLTQANTRLAKISENKSRILANMTHELRTPLNAVIGFGELLADQSENKQRREYAHFIKDSARHLLAIINDILELSRIDAGEAELNIEPVDVQLVAEDCCNMLSAKARLQNIALDMSQIPKYLRIKGDYRALMRVMVNIVGNAVKYTPIGGKVTLSAQSIGNSVLMHVRDTGIGIPESALEKVLLPFGQSRNLKKRHNLQEGTGLGLPIAKELTEAMGGQFILSSQEGIGTQIQLQFELACQKDQFRLMNDQKVD